jgi:hypothetical protein
MEYEGQYILGEGVLGHEAWSIVHTIVISVTFSIFSKPSKAMKGS